jgi:hypothetical protein
MCVYVCVCVCVCAHAHFCTCFCGWIHMQISSSGFEYSVCLHARFITICYCFLWPTSGTDSNKVAFISCYCQLRHFCMFSRPVLCVFVHINFCAVKMLIYIFIVYAALNYSFRWCQSYPVTHFGTTFHPFMFADALVYTNINKNFFIRENYGNREI